MDNGMLLMIPLVPLAGAVINGLLGRYLPRWTVGFIACAAIGLSFIFSISAFLGLDPNDPSSHYAVTFLSSWISVDNFSAGFGFLLDRLTAVMILVVSGVSFLIHIYSLGYMGHDKGYSRYFSFLNLFCFSMLLLVLADNLVLMFVGWEGVGLCSYLLIGFWFEDEEKAKAGKKAFIVNRIGDFGFLVGLFFAFSYFGTVNFKDMAVAIAGLTGASSVTLEGMATVVCVLLFVGAVGKSAQIPLYVWLPDAMAGPTPVSALIHAATMVTAGVYMIARMHFLYDVAPDARTLVLAVGTFTALFAATIAVVQNDIKKILAYSTISQLGFMFMAMGLGAYFAGIFHLVTHAFFKALLFLGAGSVIHTLGGEQDIRKMGGLKNYLVWTTITFGLGTLAISGFPLFSGWWSKDQILHEAAVSQNPVAGVAWWIALIAAMLTAFYMFRLFTIVFMGTTRVKKDELKNLHESPFSMVAPMWILAIFSVFGGFIGIKNYLEQYFSAGFEIKEGLSEAGMSAWANMGVVTIASLSAMFLSVYIYTKRKNLPEKLAAGFSGIYKLVLDKYRVDELYDLIVVRPLSVISKVFAWFDRWVVDGAVNLSAYLTRGVGFMAARLQTGLIQIYAMFLVAGLIIIMGYLFWIG